MAGPVAGSRLGAGRQGKVRSGGALAHDRDLMERVVAGQHWWEQPLRIIQLNLIVPDAARDGAQMAARVHEYGANALLINAGGIYAFYPTDVPYHRRAPGLASDLLGDAIRAAHERGVRVIVRYDLIGLHRDAYEAHPEWFYRAADGRPMIDKGLYMTCPNGGWWAVRAGKTLTAAPVPGS